MKKLGVLAAVAFLALGAASCSGKDEGDKVRGTSVEGTNKDYKVAMVTDYGDITDQSFNQSTFEGCYDYCEDHSVSFKYYKPADNSDAERVVSIKAAIAEGHNVIVMPGYAFANAIKETVNLYPDVKFIGLDVGSGDLGDEMANNMPANLYCAVYQEELCGYMAGYAAVKEGYTKLGFLGGMSVPAVVRYGYGFVQGCNDAAGDNQIEIKYAYGNQFNGDADITAAMDVWYNDGTQVVFACGGGIYTSACEAASKTNGKVIGVDVDQSYTINADYEGMCITSAMKGLYATVQSVLGNLIKKGVFENKIDTLGLVSGSDVEANYVGLPTATWSLEKFTVEDYKDLVKQMYKGKIEVKNNTDVDLSTVKNVVFQGNLK